jgi:hypothetical protein
MTMQWICVALVASARAYGTAGHPAPAVPACASDSSHGPAIHTGDVYSFYRVYDAYHGRLNADRLQHKYLVLVPKAR